MIFPLDLPGLWFKDISGDWRNQITKIPSTVALAPWSFIFPPSRWRPGGLTPNTGWLKSPGIDGSHREFSKKNGQPPVPFTTSWVWCVGQRSKIRLWKSMKDWPGWEVWLVECGWPKLGEFLRFDLVLATLKCLRVFSDWWKMVLDGRSSLPPYKKWCFLLDHDKPLL